MPEVQFYKPENSITWIVKQFESVKYKGNFTLTDKFIPRPDAAIIFHFDTRPSIVEPIKTHLKPFFIAPVVKKSNRLSVKGDLDTFVVTCKASVLSKIFNINMASVNSMLVELPHETFFPIWNDLSKCESTAERITYFSDFIIKYAPNGYSPDNIDILYDNILENTLDLSLSEIIKNSSLSLSSLQRHFVKRVGVSLKTLMRISRITYVFDMIIKEKSFDYHDFIFSGNYYDQAHFIKDFKAITGETPKQFFYHNSELCRMLSGKHKS